MAARVHVGARHSCPVLLGPLNLLLRRRPEDIGLNPDGIGEGSRIGDRPPTSSTSTGQRWTGHWGARCAPPASGGSRVGYFCGLFSWYAVQVHQTKYLIDIGFAPANAAWALRDRQSRRGPGQIAFGHLSDRIGREWVWMIGNLRFRLVLPALIVLRDHPTLACCM